MKSLSDLISRHQEAKTEAERLLTGDELVREIWPELLAYACRNISDQDLAKTLVQETLMVVIEDIDSFRGETDKNFRSWFYGIFRNKFKNSLRKKPPLPLDDLDEDELREIVEAGNREMSPGVKQDLEFALSLLAQRDAECAQLLWLHHVLGWTIIDIAEALQEAYDAVRIRLGRCLQKAQALISKQN